jgi:hypothetical protein
MDEKRLLTARILSESLPATPVPGFRFPSGDQQGVIHIVGISGIEPAVTELLEKRVSLPPRGRIKDPTRSSILTWTKVDSLTIGGHRPVSSQYNPDL